MEQQSFSHAEVFGDLHQTRFSASDAAEYLEIDTTGLFELVAKGQLAPAEGTGAAALFRPDALKAVRRTIRAKASGQM